MNSEVLVRKKPMLYVHPSSDFRCCVSAWCTVSVKTDLMIYLYRHRKFGIHLKRCIFTMFFHAVFLYMRIT